ncbi:hypothetical protein LTR28_003616, partial [Elasticomyces elasticus]
MQPTLLRRAGYGTQFEGHHGMQPWAVRPDYKTYQSPYGPKYVVPTTRKAAKKRDEHRKGKSEDMLTACTQLQDRRELPRHLLEVRGQALHLVLTKLNAHPPGEIVKAFRDLLSQQELVFFIHLLRIELADGGWTSRYIDADIKRTDMGSPADQAISIISNLLNCA